MKSQNWGTPEAKLWEWEGSWGVTQAWVDGRGRADMVDYGLGTGADTAWQGQEAGAV